MTHVIQKWNSCDAGRQLCVTHAGVFHADEVLATAILERAFGDIEVLRVIAVPDCLPEGAIVYDIGGGPLDHHQQNGNGCRVNGIPYASSGLVWRVYGKQALGTLSDAERVQSFVDDALVSRVDAADKGAIARFDDGAQSPLTVTEAISGFNPIDGNKESYDTAFLKAVKWMRAILDNSIRSAIASVSAEAEVNRAIGNAVNGLLILDRYQPWKKVLADSENPKTDSVISAIYPSVRGGFNWQVACEDREGAYPRFLAPQGWWGKEGEELQHECGVDDALFCHRSGFIGGAKTKAGAIRMAEQLVRGESQSSAQPIASAACA